MSDKNLLYRVLVQCLVPIILKRIWVIVVIGNYLKMKNENEKRNLNFWDFSKPFVNTTTAPETEKLLTNKEFEYVNQRLWSRVSLYKDSPCFGYLENFYNYYMNVAVSKNEDQVDGYYEAAMDSLKLFTFCHEKHNTHLP